MEVRIDVDALAARLKRPQTIAALADLLLRAAEWNATPSKDDDF